MEEGGSGFRLETITSIDNNGDYKRFIRLAVRDENNLLRDNHWGTSSHLRRGGGGREIPPTVLGYLDERIIHRHYPNVSTDDLNEWFFICATYNPEVKEDYSLNLDGFALTSNPNYLSDKQFWLNHKNSDGTISAQGTRSNGDLLGAKCKVEVISRSDLLRARGYKVDSLEFNVEEETPIDDMTDSETQTENEQINVG